MQFPNAPLAEVVFEMRWKVELSTPGEPFGYDPGYPFLAEHFPEEAAVGGYRTKEFLNVGVPTLAHRPLIRLRRSAEEPFPILQIGHGIFACNMGPEYEWARFRDLISFGLGALLKSHPRNKYAPMVPNMLELRYMDTFDHSLLGHSDLEKFLLENTKFGYRGLGYFRSSTFADSSDGSQLRLRKPLTKKNMGRFQLEIGSGKKDDVSAIIMTNRIVREEEFIDLGTRPDSIIKKALVWADASHKITHKFFWDFITSELMATFKNET